MFCCTAPFSLIKDVLIQITLVVLSVHHVASSGRCLLQSTRPAHSSCGRQCCCVVIRNVAALWQGCSSSSWLAVVQMVHPAAARLSCQDAAFFEWLAHQQAGLAMCVAARAEELSPVLPD
jgi:hypothetical protein